MDVELSIGEIISPDFCAPSLVIGVDRYTMQSFDGQVVQWNSYTLTSDSAQPFSRWWLVNTPGRGAHVFTATPNVPEAAEFRKELSGLVALNSEGNADLSTDIGALATYIDGFDVLYAEEVFGGTERLVFVGRPFHAKIR
ncbi:MAG: hypothetical protein DLM55_09470 [Acidimicrobiales bacterium]|nr:MAG: hypothetical protein DLM55_09470 [Acidimicrobiales bacterium]